MVRDYYTEWKKQEISTLEYVKGKYVGEQGEAQQFTHPTFNRVTKRKSDAKSDRFQFYVVKRVTLDNTIELKIYNYDVSRCIVKKEYSTSYKDAPTPAEFWNKFHSDPGIKAYVDYILDLV